MGKWLDALFDRKPSMTKVSDFPMTDGAKALLDIHMKATEKLMYAFLDYMATMENKSTITVEDVDVMVKKLKLIGVLSE